MAERFSEWDPADYLRTEDEVIAYLDAWLEDGTTQEIAAAIGDVARSQGMTRIAERTGLNRVSLYKALGDDGNPSFDTIVRVLSALGYHFQIARGGVTRDLVTA